MAIPAGDVEHGTDDADEHVAQVADEAHNRTDHTGEELRFPCLSEVFAIARVEFIDGRIFTRERFHLSIAAVHLFDMRVELAECFLLALEVALRTRCDTYRSQKRERQRGERNERQDPRNREHEDDHRNECDHRRDDLHERFLQGRRDKVDIVGDAREDLSLRAAIVVGKRHAIELRLHIAAQAIDHFLSHLRHDELADELAYRIGHVEQHEREKDAVERDEIESTSACHHAFEGAEHFGGRLTEHERRDRIAQRSRHREDEYDHQKRNEWLQARNEATQGLRSVLRLFFAPCTVRAVRSVWRHAIHLPYRLRCSSLPAPQRKVLLPRVERVRARDRPDTTRRAQHAFRTLRWLLFRSAG